MEGHDGVAPEMMPILNPLDLKVSSGSKDVDWRVCPRAITQIAGLTVHVRKVESRARWKEYVVLNYYLSYAIQTPEARDLSF